MDQFDREEQDIMEREARGEITAAEARKEMSELHRAYRESAEEASRDAYDREMDRW